MNNILAIRREDKNEWERRTPLTPSQVATLVQEHGLRILVQPSPIRAFTDEEYAAVGAMVQEDLSSANVILAIKEIPSELLQPGKTYLFFSHTIKGQPHNMPMLRQLMELGCQLIDYERVTDDQGRRLIAFGKYAGLAGAIDTLHLLGQRLAWEGIPNPLLDLRLTYQYADLPQAQRAVRAVGQRIAKDGLPDEVTPLVIGVAGYGNVSRGVQAILDLLPTRQLSPDGLAELIQSGSYDRHTIYKVVFREADTVERLRAYPKSPLSAPVPGGLLAPRTGLGAFFGQVLTAGQGFELQEFIKHPERYRSRFEQYLPYLTVLFNCIYWDSRYPRLVTKAAIRQLYSDDPSPRLRIIGDISCDIEGAIEPTIKATSPEQPAFVWDVNTGTAVDGVAGRGPVIMAVDNLPCELPIESSTAFGAALLPFVPALAVCDFRADFEACPLPPELKRATIVYHGRLTPPYNYLTQYL